MAPKWCRRLLRVLGVYWELAGTVGTQGQKVHQEATMGVGVIRVYWGTDRECRGSGASIVYGALGRL